MNKLDIISSNLDFNFLLNADESPNDFGKNH